MHNLVKRVVKKMKILLHTYNLFTIVAIITRRFINKLKKHLRRKIQNPVWGNFRQVKPFSRVFGFDRGQPIDRYYIEKFLLENCHYIKGVVLEIGDDLYSKKFRTNIEKIEILNYADSPKATIIGDLTDVSTLPKNKIDSFICTQTLNFVYNFQDAIKGSYYLLKKDGVILATVAGISQISRYDMNRWGDYWRFTPLSIQKAFTEVFGKDNVKVNYYGNVLSSIAFLEGLAGDELTKAELDYKDPDYPVSINIFARKI